MTSFIKYFLMFILWFAHVKTYCNETDPQKAPLDSLGLLVKDETLGDLRYEYLWQLTLRYTSINIDSAYHYGTMYLKLANKKNNIKEMANAKFRLSLVCRTKGQTDRGFKLIHEAIDTYKKLGDKSGLAKAYINLGVLNYNSGEQPLAAQNWLDALEIQEQILPLDTMIIASVRINIADVLRRTEQYDLAYDQLDLVEILISKTSPRLAVKVLINKHLISEALEDYDKSLEFLLRALPLSKTTEDKATEATIYQLIARVYMELKDYRASKDYYVKAYEGFKKLKDRRYLDAITFGYGMVLFKLGEIEEAEKFFNETITANKQNREFRKLTNSYDMLASIDSLKGDFHGAFLNKQMAYMLKDSVQEVDRAKELKEITAKYEVDKKNEEIQLLKQQEEIQALQLGKQRNIILTAVIIIISLLTLSFLLLKWYRLKKSLNTKLRIRNQRIESQNRIIQSALQEKELLLKEVYHRTKNNLMLVSSLLGIAVEHGVENNAKATLIDSYNRVRSIALIHQMLYEHKSQGGLDTQIPNYIQAIVKSIEDSFRNSSDIQIRHVIEPVLLDMNVLIPIGLIINEAVTNAIKHAFFSGQSDKTVVIFLGEEDGHMILRIEDNGQRHGNAELSTKKNGFGLELIRGLADQIESNLYMNFENGGLLRLKLPLANNQHKAILPATTTI